MPPKLALFLCILFILYLFKMDSSRESTVSRALWIPLIWMIIIGSRPVTIWLNPGAGQASAASVLDGSPIDRIIFLLLTVTGIFILSKREIYWPAILQRNLWIFLFILYGGISIVWSDFPFVSFKRWVKAIGSLVMVLIVLTERDFTEAVKTMIRRCAYVLIPLSILFIKYYPHLGRSFSFWTGEAYNSGVTYDKNALGRLCLVSGFFFFWSLLTIWHRRTTSVDKKEVVVHILFLIMISWLLKMANSATSLSAFIMGICIMVVLGLPFMRRNARHIGSFIFLAIIVASFLQLSFNIYEDIVTMTGRDATLTGRIELWKNVLDMGTNPLIGTGYDSFWLGDRLTKLWAIHWWRPNQAHNGYIETYLNLGWIGLFFLIGIIVASYRNICKSFMYDFDLGRFRMAFLIITLVYNYTEAAFKGLSLMWFVFLLIALECQPIAVSGSRNPRRQ